jgi:hypothetical protein
MEPHNPPWQRGALANDGFSFRPPPIFLPATPDAATEADAALSQKASRPLAGQF